MYAVRLLLDFLAWLCRHQTNDVLPSVSEVDGSFIVKKISQNLLDLCNASCMCRITLASAVVYLGLDNGDRGACNGAEGRGICLREHVHLSNQSDAV